LYLIFVHIKAKISLSELKVSSFATTQGSKFAATIAGGHFRSFYPPDCNIAPYSKTPCDCY